jgi:hypothetical protein
MYFPGEAILEVKDILRNLTCDIDLSEKISVIDSCIENLERARRNTSFFGGGRHHREIEDLIVTLKNARCECISSTASIFNIGLILSSINDKVNLVVESDLKPYKNLCIFLLSHPKNNSIAGTEILSRINYLDKMTRDVTFIMPGYKRAQLNDEIINEPDNNLQLTFDEDLFIKMVQELEDKSNGKFLYKDMCELLFIGIDSADRYDFNNFQRLDLNFLSQKRGIDPVKLIISIAQQFRTDMNDVIEVKKYVNQILGEMTIQDTAPTIKIFIAGAKNLKKERSILREELSKVENTHDIDIRSLTFEDFATSLTGIERGRQADYNKFIEEDAKVVIFIFDSTVGDITEEEFDIAYNSLKENNHPDIFVYVRKKTFPNLKINSDPRLQKIISKIFDYQKEYYVEYEDLEQLRYLFYRDMVSYFIKQKK